MSIESEVTQPENEVTTVVEAPIAETVAEEITTVVDEQAEAAKKKMAEDMKKKEEEMMKMKAALDAALTELQVANEALAGYKMKEEEMVKKDKKMKRMATLLESGVTEEVASATVEKFEALDDETFASMTSLLASVKTAQPVVEDTKAEETEVKSDDVSLALENVETNDQEIDLSVGSETESEMQSTRAALVDFVCIRLGKKLNKGE